MTTTALPPTSDRAARVAAALAALGLDKGATSGDIEAAYAELVDYLEQAPPALDGWAAEQLERADEAHAALTSLQNGRAKATTAAIRPAKAAAGYLASDADDPDELFDMLDGGAVSAPARKPVDRSAPRVRRTRAIANGRDDRFGLIRAEATSRRFLLGGGVLVAAVAAILVIYQLGQPVVPGLTGSPAPAATRGVDQARVVAFMDKLAKDDKDKTALQGLADLYYAAGDYATASTWLDKLIAVDPKNVTALLGAGAAAYNQGKLDVAEARWRSVLEVDAKNVEAHYDLGFMYLSQDPPQMDKVRTEWNAVIAADPNSDVAKTVAAHLKNLDPSLSPGPSGASPAPSGSPAPSPASSAVPSPLPSPR